VKALSHVKMQKPHHVRTTFGRLDVEKLHDSAVKNAQSTPASLFRHGAHFQGGKKLKTWNL